MRFWVKDNKEPGWVPPACGFLSASAQDRPPGDRGSWCTPWPRAGQFVLQCHLCSCSKGSQSHEWQLPLGWPSHWLPLTGFPSFFVPIPMSSKGLLGSPPNTLPAPSSCLHSAFEGPNLRAGGRGWDGRIRTSSLVSGWNGPRKAPTPLRFHLPRRIGMGIHARHGS